jgi:hypothetical protein
MSIHVNGFQTAFGHANSLLALSVYIDISFKQTLE